MHICFQKRFWKQPLPDRILHPCSKTTIWNGLKNCLVLAIQTSSMQGVYTEGEEDMIKTKLLKVFFVLFLLNEKNVVFFYFVLQSVRPTLWPAHPIIPLLDKRGLTLMSVSTPRPWGQSPLQTSLGTDGWLLWNPQVHISENVVILLSPLLLQVVSTCTCVLWTDVPYCWWQHNGGVLE